MWKKLQNGLKCTRYLSKTLSCAKKPNASTEPYKQNPLPFRQNHFKIGIGAPPKRIFMLANLLLHSTTTFLSRWQGSQFLVLTVLEEMFFLRPVHREHRFEIRNSRLILLGGRNSSLTSMAPVLNTAKRVLKLPVLIFAVYFPFLDNGNSFLLRLLTVQAALTFERGFH